jgi:selenide, water dikinase
MTGEPLHIVLLGAGHAHVEVLRSFGFMPPPAARVTLVTRLAHTPYSGMLPGLIAGVYGFDDAHIDTRPLARFAGAELVLAEVTGIDTAGKQLILKDHQPIAYDILSVNTGSTPGGTGLDGIAQNAIPVKPIDGFLERFEACRQRVMTRGGAARIGVVGGGAAGVELALALAARLRRDLVADGLGTGRFSVALFAGGGGLLPTFPAGARQRVARSLAAHDISVTVGARVIRFDGTRLGLDDGTATPIDELFFATQAAAASWLRESGLSLDDAGFIAVDARLRSISHPDVFAAGDIASFTPQPLPKSGVYAVRQGPALAENLRRVVAGMPPMPWTPQRQALVLIATGDGSAVGTRNGLSVEGRWVWRWKDRIDRAFMARYRDLPTRDGTVGPAEQ